MRESLGVPSTTPATATYAAIVQILAWVAVATLHRAVGLRVALAFVLGGRSRVPESTRRSRFLLATLCVATWAVFSIFFVSVLAGIVRYL